MDKPKDPNEKKTVPVTAASKPVLPASDRKVPPLFRRIDWLALVVTFLFVFIGYMLTLAPEMTLEDSGELAVGSYYAGIPHPPGYPVWTLFTHLWTVLLPFKNVAWRVAVSCAFAGALASGMLALVVSRGSSMIIESIDDLKNIDRRWENLICIVSGFVAGALIGFNGYMWSQSVIVEVYPLSVVSLMGVVVFLLRWVYAPHQYRYLYWAFFSYGICFNNHQSLLVIAMGMEVLIWLAEPKLGRELFFWNTLIFLLGLGAGLTAEGNLLGNSAVKAIFYTIGISSALLWIWLCFSTGKKAIEFGRDLVMLLLFGLVGLLFLGITNYIPSAGEGVRPFFLAVGSIGAAVGFVTLIRRTRDHSRSWAATLACGGSWLAGAAFYLYMPIAGATNPPMQWGYPRTLDGFIHAITRGQYEKINPTTGVGDNAIEVISSFVSRYGMQLWRFLEGLNDEFNILSLLIALVVFLFFRKMKRRERVWIIGSLALWICVGPFLVLLLNFSSDRQSLELNRVFLTSSHVFVSMSVGFGLTLLAASMAAHFDSLRKISLFGSLCAIDLAVFILVVNSQIDLNPDTASKYGFFKILCWLAAIICVVVLWRKGLQHDRLLALGVPGLFILASGAFTVMALVGDPPQHNAISNVLHAIGAAFDPYQYGLPIFAALILVAGGLVFAAAALLSRSKPPMAVMLGLFALMPSYSILTHWFNNEQRDHYFGYWFGHDMFTPPFEAADGSFSYDAQKRKEAMNGPKGNLVYPEMTRDAILFGGTDPGRFAPTYMIFCDSFIPARCKPEADRAFDRRDVYIITQNALADGTYLNYIRAHYFRSDQYQYDTPFFQQLLRGPEERKPKSQGGDYTTNIVARIAGTLLDGPIQRRGARIEARWRTEGVYPRKEIYIPTPKDSERCFSEYTSDAARRMDHDLRNPGEPKQIRGGEIVTFTPDGRVSVSGQVAVMAINGLLTKVIFDKNPTNEFFVEESFPLDWMYPHLTPFGVIMKINRQPVSELTDEVVQRDHAFWSKFSERLIGNWITYETPVKEIADFAERVYLRHNFKGYQGDWKFVRDDQAQKAFSKLRSSIAGVYAWRLGLSGSPMPQQYLPKNEAERQRMLREADFAFKQAFAFCPYSPEAVFRYVNLLAYTGRMGDAILVAETCAKLDPYNKAIADVVKSLKTPRDARPDPVAEIQTQIVALENELRTNTNNAQKTYDLAYKYLQLQQVPRGTQLLDSILSNPTADVSSVFNVARLYYEIGYKPKAEAALQRLVQIAPTAPEAWYNLAATKAELGKSAEALDDLKKALDLHDAQVAQRAAGPGSRPELLNLRAEVEKDPRFVSLRDLPEYKAMISAKKP